MNLSSFFNNDASRISKRGVAWGWLLLLIACGSCPTTEVSAQTQGHSFDTSRSVGGELPGDQSFSPWQTNKLAQKLMTRPESAANGLPEGEIAPSGRQGTLPPSILAQYPLGSSEEENIESADEAEAAESTEGDDELGILRLQERPVGADMDLGILRIREIDELPPEPIPAPSPSVFLTGRAGAFGNTNLFRAIEPQGEQVYRVGLGLFAFPEITEGTNLIAGIEGNLVRYGQLDEVNYNELQLQAGIRQRLSERTYGQISWRNQRLYVPGGDEFFSTDYVELLLSRRDILSYNMWLDSYYQARVSFSQPDTFSRFSQSVTASLNYGFTRQFRATIVYQLFLDDYTQIARYDTYHQALGQLTYDLSPSSRLNLFTGYRFGRSSLDTVNFEDFIYGASYNFSLPLF